MGLWDLVWMPFLGRREVGNLREFRTDPWEGGNIFLVNHSWDEYFISNDFFLEVLGYLGCEEGPFRCVRRGPGGQGAAASQLQVPLWLRGSGQPSNEWFNSLIHVWERLAVFDLVTRATSCSLFCIPAVSDRSIDCALHRRVTSDDEYSPRQPLTWSSAFLPQEDVVMGTLTVRENLRFSAALRLPTSVPQSEKEARVNHLIKELGLTKVADSKVRIDSLVCSSPHFVVLVSTTGVFVLRWARRWAAGSLEERGRGRTSVWSSSSTPRSSSWMNQPRDWTPAPPTLSCSYWNGRKGTSRSLHCNLFTHSAVVNTSVQEKNCGSLRLRLTALRSLIK